MRKSEPVLGSSEAEIFPSASYLVFKGLRKVLVIILLVFLLAKVIDWSQPAPTKTIENHYDWEGYDPGRPITDMNHIDWVNHRIGYAELNTGERNRAAEEYRELHQSLGVDIEAILQNQDYYDLMDQYKD